MALPDILLVSLIVLATVAPISGERATFVKYQVFTQYQLSGGRRSLSEVSAELTAWPEAPSAIYPIGGSRLWKTTLIASENADGSANLKEFPDVALDQPQAKQPYRPGETLRFVLPLELDVDTHFLNEGFRFVCLKTEKEASANPDFEFVMGADDFAFLCLEIEVGSVDSVVASADALVDSHELAVQTSRTGLTNLHLETTNTLVFNRGSARVIGGEAIWLIQLFVSETADGSGAQYVISENVLDQDQAALGVSPGGTLTFVGSESFDSTSLSVGPGMRYPYICTKLQKDSRGDNIELSIRGEDTITQCVEIPSIPGVSGPDSLAGSANAQVESHELAVKIRGAELASLNLETTNTLVFDGDSAQVPGGEAIWQIQVFVSEREDGSGGQFVISDNILDQDQASLGVSPGSTLTFVGSESSDFTSLSVGPGMTYPYICTKLQKDSIRDNIELSFRGEDTITHCVELPSIPGVPGPVITAPRAQVDTHELAVRLSAVDLESVNFETTNTLVFNGESAQVPGGAPIWRLRFFVSETSDGSGGQYEISSDLLDPDQASLGVNPGDTLTFVGAGSLDVTRLSIGAGETYPYICTEIQKDSSGDSIELFYDGGDTITHCIEYSQGSAVPGPEAINVAEQVRLDAHELMVSKITRSGAQGAILDFDVTNRFVLGDTSASVDGGQSLWRLRVFAGENVYGTGGHLEITPQALDLTQSAKALRPGEEVEFINSLSYDLSDVAIGPGTDFPYVCAVLDSMVDNYEVIQPSIVSDGDCFELPALPTFRTNNAPVLDKATCSLWGDPHTRTFDGYGYTHQGDDGFIAVTTCNNEESDLPDFEVVVENYRRKPSKPITYIRELRLYYNGVVYALTHPNEASVDGVKVTFPYVDAENGVKIEYAPPNKILTTDFGLTMRFDNDHSGDVTLPLGYQNRVCGLCGNFDGRRFNECQNRDGSLMNVHNEECKINHTIEWRYTPPGVPPPPIFPEDFKPALRPCDEGSPYLAEARRHCDILSDESGPLAVCHRYATPVTYYQTCTYDLCQLLPEVFFLCGSIETYVYDCARASNYEAEIGDWRSVATQCESPCAEDMVFNPHGRACPRTCVNPEGSKLCPDSAVGVCECPDGMVLDGTKCVPLEECGCMMTSGRYLSIGEEFMNSDCSEHCSCVSNGDLQCTSVTCTENASCGTKAGVKNCYCDEGYLGDGQLECNKTGRVCHIYGDPHFHTFDGDFYSFQGDCTYTAVKTCKPLPSGVPHFRVMVKNDALIPEERFTYMTMIRLHFSGITYRLKYTGEVSANGENVAKTLPYQDEHVTITREGNDIVLRTNFGLKIFYDGESDARIEIPPEVSGKVCGLCGNADGDDTNDKQKPDGTLAKKLEFANSWGVEGCSSVKKQVTTCEPDTKEYEQSVDICSELVSAEGPFAHCHDFKSPFSFFQSCIYDLCGTLPSTHMFCSSALAYLEACSEKGGRFDRDWESTVKYCGAVECPEDYTEYRQSCYKFVSEPAPYDSAGATCKAEGGHLAAIITREENEFVASLAQNERAWLGASRDTSASFTTYDSAASAPYTFLPGRLTRGVGSFRFSVQAHSGAHLLLSTFKDVGPDSPVYEIILGADRNKQNFLKRCQECEPKAESSKSILNKRKSRDFFVNFHEGRIQVGDMKTRELILEYQDPLPMRVRYIAFRTEGRVGTWKFYEPEYKWDNGQSWTYDNYRLGEPSNFVHMEDCLETNYMQPGIWNDHFCSEPKPFVCEIDG